MATEAGELRRNTRVSDCNNCITNGLELTESYSGALHLTSANNDDRVRVFDLERPQPVHEFPLEWAANAATVNPRNRCALPYTAQCVPRAGHWAAVMRRERSAGTCWAPTPLCDSLAADMHGQRHVVAAPTHALT